jgi:hypothetical protein
MSIELSRSSKLIVDAENGVDDQYTSSFKIEAGFLSLDESLLSFFGGPRIDAPAPEPV